MMMVMTVYLPHMEIHSTNMVNVLSTKKIVADEIRTVSLRRGASEQISMNFFSAKLLYRWENHISCFPIRNVEKVAVRVIRK
jgi:hypothetical protein